MRLEPIVSQAPASGTACAGLWQSTPQQLRWSAQIAHTRPPLSQPSTSPLPSQECLQRCRTQPRRLRCQTSSVLPLPSSLTVSERESLTRRRSLETGRQTGAGWDGFSLQGIGLEHWGDCSNQTGESFLCVARRSCEQGPDYRACLCRSNSDTSQRQNCLKSW